MARAKTSDLARAIRTRRIEATALAVLALLPIVPYLTLAMRPGVTRFELLGDIARVEQATRHVWTGDTLVGLRSSFGWNHPGPLYFYLLAPLEALVGVSGIFIGTTLINGAAAATLVASTRLFARRAHAIAALAIVLMWFVAFGNIVATPWTPLVVVLPLMTFLVTISFFARGKTSAIFPAVFFGAFVIQTHVAAVTTVLASGFVSTVAFLVGARRRGGLGWGEQLRLGIAFAFILVAFLPPVVEQLASPVGNFTRAWKFFSHREAPLHPLVVAVQEWATASGWLPGRAFGRSLFADGAVPLFTRIENVPYGVTTVGRFVAIAYVFGVAVAAPIAWKRGDTSSIALIAVGTLANAIAMSALQAVVGPTTYPLLVWTTGVSAVAWIGIFSAIFSAIGASLLEMPRITNTIAPALIVLGLASAVTATTFQKLWLGRIPGIPGSHPELRNDLHAMQAGVRQKIAQTGAIPIIHREGAKDIADSVVLELEKDHVDLRVAEDDRRVFVALRSSTGASRGIHFWISTTQEPFKFTKCTELVAKSGDASLYASPTVPTVCP